MQKKDMTVLNGNTNLLDIVKIIMAVLVVSLHMLPLYGYEDSFIYRIWWICAQTAVPIFFVSTGYFIQYKSNKTGGN